MGNGSEIIKEAGNAAEKVGGAFDDNFTSKEEKIELLNKDRDSAREMQKVSIQAGKRWTTSDFLAIYWSIVASAYIFATTFFAVPENNQRLADTITGFLMGTIIAAIINFFFGSSVGSKLKTEQSDGLLRRIFNKNTKD